MAGRRSDPGHLRIALEGAERRDLAVYVLDRAGTVLQQAPIDAKGTAAVPAGSLEKAHEVVIAAAGVEGRPAGARFHAADVLETLRAGATLELGAADLAHLSPLRTCVEGSVRKCWFPWPALADLTLRASVIRSSAFDHTAAHAHGLSPRTVAGLEDALVALPRRPWFPRRCTRVCDGLVIAYRRRCCCQPLVVDDPRLDDLLDELDDLVVPWPPIPWPPEPDPPVGPRPGPGPDPAPLGLFRGGTLDAAALYARRDAYAIRSLPAAERPRYVLDRPYLRPYWCHCSAPVQAGQASLRPDGTFRICWWGTPFPSHGCHDEVAFVVRQSVNGSTITVYDGLAANEWFDLGDEIVLTTYDRRTITCREDPFPEEGGAFVVLQDIGSTPSHRLKTPASDGALSVQAPAAYNDGLVNPAPSPAAAKGALLDQNWGGSLALRYHFSETMRAAPVGARYYRISVAAADANGDPVGPRTTIDAPLSWLYYEVVGTDVWVKSQVLGPVSVGGEAGLFAIPFDADRDWQSGQVHGVVPSTSFADGRHLVTVEVFDGAGNRLRPATGAAEPGAPKPFHFRRWSQPTGPMDDVPFAALTHLFWWDNRPSVGTIVDLRKNGVASSAECQFLVGKDGATFSVGYRAYHPNPLFILNHVLWWRRGLGGPSGTLLNSPDNAGQPPAAAAVTPTTSPPASPAPTFANMLGAHAKCSFSVNLHVNVKTTNGSGLLETLDADDQAAFALERTGP